jgi:hypothetical protein
MTTYTIIPKVEQTGFDVAIVGNDGARQTLLGFEPRQTPRRGLHRTSGRVPPMTHGRQVIFGRRISKF